MFKHATVLVGYASYFDSKLIEHPATRFVLLSITNFNSTLSMKKIMRFLPMLLIAVLGAAAWSCSDNDDEVISGETIPTAAKAFITQYFPSAKIVTATKDKNEYEVTLSEGTRIDFNISGEWTDVDAAAGKTVPSGFYPEGIDAFIAENLNSVGINEIEKNRNGYEVELLTGADLTFDYEGGFTGYAN